MAQITYQRFPILKWIRKPYKCNVTYASSEPKLGAHIMPIAKDPKFFMSLFGHSVDYLSRPFVDCLCRSTTAFQNIIQEPGFMIEPYSGVILTEQFGTIAYICSGEELHCYQFRGIVAMATSTVNFKDKTCLSLMDRDLKGVLKEGLSDGYKATEEECAAFLPTVIITYLLMLRYARIEEKKMYPRQKVEEAASKDGKEHDPWIQNLTDLRINYRTSRWFTSIVCDHDFSVRGHFRLQPKKINGEWTKELIYINQYVKHGYHRMAEIEKITKHE